MKFIIESSIVVIDKVVDTLMLMFPVLVIALAVFIAGSLSLFLVSNPIEYIVLIRNIISIVAVSVSSVLFVIIFFLLFFCLVFFCVVAVIVVCVVDVYDYFCSS